MALRTPGRTETDGDGATGSDGAGADARLHGDVRALRAQLRERQVAIDRRTSAGTMLVAGAGGLALAGAALLTTLSTDAVRVPGWDAVAAMIASRTAADLVGRVFALY